ncbi:uncharacterized protein LOC120113690 [Hibiscus syriacus]|uniref:uncharacterized protein LOC120113690 n=1 Tax=Hibiscus syriacus TaxID=106335 RepID=UPI001921126D|nr:uncharacterized protein LOC120113690 [Hibiscus syriacus]
MQSRTKKMQHSWKLNIQARTKIFNFKLKATRILPAGGFHRFSLLLRLHNFILKLRLKSGSSVSISTQQKRTFKSTFLGLLDKLRLRRANRALTIRNPDLKSLLNPFANKDSNGGGSFVIAIIALLLQSNRHGIITLASLVLLYWILYFEKHLRGETRSFWMVLIAGAAGSWVAFNLGKGYVSNYAWNWIEWSYGYTVFSGFLYAALKVIFALVKTIFYFSKLK